jgi:predicted transcriptional regulator
MNTSPALRIDCLLTDSAVFDVLEHHQPIKQTEIADMLGMGKNTVNRSIKRLKSRGCITVKQTAIRRKGIPETYDTHPEQFNARIFFGTTSYTG